MNQSAPRVFGLGLSRTGTSSLKAALDILGFGPCYHVSEVLKHPHLAYQFDLYAKTGNPDLATILSDYRSACDVPIFLYWREIFKIWPGSRFVLTVRNAASWYESVTQSIMPVLVGASIPVVPGHEFAHNMCRDVIMERLMAGRSFQPDIATEVFRSHYNAVMLGIPSDQLLVMNISDGWKPLCRFLGADIPEEPFPCLNSRLLLNQHRILLRPLLKMPDYHMIGGNDGR